MFWLTSFIFLYAALYLFERDHVRLDWFQVLVVALVPAIVSALRATLSMLAPVPAAVNGSIFLLGYPIVFLLLWKMMTLERNRAIAYAAALFGFDMAVFAFVTHFIGPWT